MVQNLHKNQFQVPSLIKFLGLGLPTAYHHENHHSQNLNPASTKRRQEPLHHQAASLQPATPASIPSQPRSYAAASLSSLIVAASAVFTASPCRITKPTNPAPFPVLTSPLMRAQPCRSMPRPPSPELIQSAASTSAHAATARCAPARRQQQPPKPPHITAPISLCSAQFCRRHREVPHVPSCPLSISLHRVGVAVLDVQLASPVLPPATSSLSRLTCHAVPIPPSSDFQPPSSLLLPTS